jgi:hypothetical protein
MRIADIGPIWSRATASARLMLGTTLFLIKYESPDVNHIFTMEDDGRSGRAHSEAGRTTLHFTRARSNEDSLGEVQSGTIRKA